MIKEYEIDKDQLEKDWPEYLKYLEKKGKAAIKEKLDKYL